MKFSYFHLMPYTDLAMEDYTGANAPGWPFTNRDQDPHKVQQMYRTYVDDMVHAESCGFDWVGCNEHHYTPYGMMANPNIIGGALAYRTSRARIAMIGNIIPINNPVRVAEEYAMLDCMSGGRLMAGFMRGIPHEYIAYNLPPSESWERQREAIALIKKCWTEPEPFGWEGKHFQFKQIAIWPKPFQKPHPPFLVSASNPDSARFAGEVGATMGMVLISDLDSTRECIEIYRESARQHGWEPKAENVLIGMHCLIADSDEEARRWMASGREYFNKLLMSPQREAMGMVIRETRYFQDDASRDRWRNRLASRGEATLEQAIDRGTIICGSPETVVAQIKRVHAALGHGVFNFTVKVGNVPDAVIRHGMELFRDRVLPHVRDL